MPKLCGDTAAFSFLGTHRGLMLVDYASRDVNEYIYPFLLEDFMQKESLFRENKPTGNVLHMIDNCKSIFSFYQALWLSLDEYYLFINGKDCADAKKTFLLCEYFREYSNKILSMQGRGDIAQRQDQLLVKMLILIDDWLSQEIKIEHFCYLDEISRLLYLTLLAQSKLTHRTKKQNNDLDKTLERVHEKIIDLEARYVFSDEFKSIDKALLFDLTFFSKTVSSLKEIDRDSSLLLALEKIKELVDLEFLRGSHLNINDKVKKFNKKRERLVVRALTIGCDNKFSDVVLLNEAFNVFDEDLKAWQNHLFLLIEKLSRLREAILELENELSQERETPAIKHRQVEALKKLSDKLSIHLAKSMKISDLELELLKKNDDYALRISSLENILEKKTKEFKLFSEQGKAELGIGISIGIAYGEILKIRSHWNKTYFYHCFFYLTEPMYRVRVSSIENAYQNLKLSQTNAFGIETNIQQEKRKILNDEQELAKVVQDAIGGFLVSNNFNYRW